jgi:SAM-dependent methyltransferase
MPSRRYKYSRYAMYTTIEKVIKSKKLKPGKCLLIGDSIKGKGNEKVKIRNPAITNMLPKGCEILAPSYPDVDIHKMPYEDNSFDYVIADQVLEHVRRPWIGVEEVRRVLKPGGLTILTSALIFPVHGVPHDYWRFTPEGLKVLCENFSKIYECSGTGDLNFVIDILKGRRKLQVASNTELEKRALACDNKNLVSVWIIAEK